METKCKECHWQGDICSGWIWMECWTCPSCLWWLNKTEMFEGKRRYWQALNPRSGEYTLIDIKHWEILDHTNDGEPYEWIYILKGKHNDE